MFPYFILFAFLARDRDPETIRFNIAEVSYYEADVGALEITIYGIHNGDRQNRSYYPVIDTWQAANADELNLLIQFLDTKGILSTPKV